MPSNNSLFVDPREDLKDAMKKPFLMSKKKWQKMQNKYSQAQNIIHEDELAANEQRMGMFNDLFQNLSGFEGLEQFGNLEADYGMGVENIFAAMSPLMAGIAEEQNRPQDAQLSNFTVNPSIIPNYKKGGEVTGDSLELAQTEEGEVYVQTDLTMSDTKSKSTHKKMDDDEVTDIFAEGGYVFSDNVKIKKKDADIVFGYSQPLYEEADNDSKVKEHNFLDLFKDSEKELGTAELANRIKDKYKIIDEDDTYGNPMIEKTNEENRESRDKWIATLIMLTEDSKGPKRNLDVKKYSKGGKIAKSPKGVKPKKYDDPDWTELLNLIPGVGSAAKAVFDVFGMFKQNKQHNKNVQELEQLVAGQQSNLGMGTLSTLASTFAQDPSETAPDLTATIRNFQQQFRRTPQYLKDYGASQIDRTSNQMASQLTQSAPDFQTLSANIANLQSNALANKSDFAANTAAQDVNMNNAYLRGLSTLYNQDANNQAQKANQERSNRNQQIVRTGDTVSNYMNQVNALDASAFATKMSLQGQNAAAQNALSNSLFQNTMLAANSFSSIGSQPRENPYSFRDQPYSVPGPADVRQSPVSPFQLSPLAPETGIGREVTNPYINPYTRLG